MKSASISELKANLSRYLGMVRRGSEVEVLDRGVPIARIVGLSSAGRSRDKERLMHLAESGVLRRNTTSLSWVLEEPAVKAERADLQRALDEDRGDRL
ncbi:MAG: type II toxin-antitoxin system prevent-host-death family antitoxin [Polyangiaceae bacterium]|nr:type II toxin-antitoxin system prevent-host-death family antitoxin [Polyangiaceae bacterium]